MRDYFKIIRQDADGYLSTLFHGNHGSRKVSRWNWITAQIREEAKDGPGTRTYRSGWHVLEELDQAVAYLKKFRNLDDLAIVRCKIAGDTWQKEHSPAIGLVLSQKIYFMDTVMTNTEIKEALNGR